MAWIRSCYAAEWRNTVTGEVVSDHEMSVGSASKAPPIFTGNDSGESSASVTGGGEHPTGRASMETMVGHLVSQGLPASYAENKVRMAARDWHGRRENQR